MPLNGENPKEHTYHYFSTFQMIFSQIRDSLNLAEATNPLVENVNETIQVVVRKNEFFRSLPGTSRQSGET